MASVVSFATAITPTCGFRWCSMMLAVSRSVLADHSNDEVIIQRSRSSAVEPTVNRPLVTSSDNKASSRRAVRELPRTVLVAIRSRPVAGSLSV